MNIRHVFTMKHIKHSFSKSKIIIQRVSLVLSDVLSMFLSLVLVIQILNFIRPGADHIALGNLGIAKLVGLLLIIVFWYQEQYVKRRPIWEEIRLTCTTIFIFSLFHLGASYLVSHHVIKLLNVLFWVCLIFMLPILRYVTKQILIKLTLWQRDLYIIGFADNAIATYRLLMANKILGYNFLGFINLKLADLKHANVPDEIYIDNMPQSILNKDALLNGSIYEKASNTEIIFAVSSLELLNYSKLINILQARYAFISIVPDIAGLPLYGVELNHFFGNEQLFLRLQNNLGRRFNRIIKRFTDIILSLAGIIVLSPLLVVLAILVRASTGSYNVIFKHQRIGLNGKHFYCMKFKTMYENSQEILAQLLASDEAVKQEWERDFKLKDDPRITRVGKFLRKSSLDELPQLFNVLLGEMSLVGPRPIIDAELLRYGEDAYYYKLVRPGITGLWQISGRNDIDYTTRVRLDVYYVKNWSLWYDFVILLKTVFVVLTKGGAY
jgi:Undecaprenyl-phosphate galactose phosphotransferase WbaP